MKKLILFMAIALSLYLKAEAQQEQDTDNEPFYYEVSGLVYVNQYEAETKTFSTDTKIPRPPLKFKVVRSGTNSQNQTDYVIIQFLAITSDKLTDKISLTNNDTYVNSEDNDEYFWLSKSDLDSYLTNGFIKKRYRAPHGVLDYGASVSLPFKYRPGTDGQFSKITPDIALGGYIGFKWRLSHYQPYYLTAPVVTLGLSTISINDNTVTPTTLSTNSAPTADGLILGITGSTGAVLKFGDFQVGFIVGWDHATGEIGRNWIYNDKAWYSLSVGYSFLGSK